jgi:carbon storage regulator
MLVLSRQKDESIMIGDEVEITIVDVRGDKVRLGITAPKSIPVHRREIYDAIQREKAQQANGQLQTGSNNESAEKTGDSARPRTEKPEKTSQK